MSKIEFGVSRFINNNQGGTAMRIALLFGAIGMAVAILATPLLDNVSQRYAASEYGVDRTVTGAITGPKPRSYVIRRSVLDPEPKRICRSGDIC